MADVERLSRALKAAHAAGDSDAAAKLAAALRQVQAAPQIVRDEAGQMPAPSGRSLTSRRDEIRWRDRLAEAEAAGDAQGAQNARRMLNEILAEPAPEEPSPWERFGSGAASVAGGINQLVPESMGGFSAEEEREFAAGRRLYDEARPEGVDWFGLGGEAAAVAPFVLAPQFRGANRLFGRTIAGGGGGALGGGMLFAETPQDRALNMVAGGVGGAAGGAVLPPLVSAGVAGANRLMPRPRLPADAALRQTQAARFGYEGDAAPTRGRLLQDPNMITDEENVARLPGGEGLQARMAAQGAQDEANLEGLVGRYGGPTEPGRAGTELVEGIQRRSEDWQSEVAAKYDAARRAAPDATLPGDRLRDAFAPVLKERRNAIPADVRRRIAELSETDVDPIELENLDKLMSDYVGADRATNAAIRILKTRLRDEIDRFSSQFGGAYREAVSEAAGRFQAMGPDTGLTSRAERGALDPIKIVPRIKGAGLKELETLRDFVATQQPEAWQAARAGIMTDIAQRSTPSGNFSQAAYNRSIQSIGRERLEILFGREGAQELFEFGEVVRDLYGPVRGATPNRSGTEIMRQRLMDSMMSRILRSVPLVGDIVEASGEAAAARANARRAAEALEPRPRRALSPTGPTLSATRATGALAGPLGVAELRNRLNLQGR